MPRIMKYPRDVAGILHKELSFRAKRVKPPLVPPWVPSEVTLGQLLDSALAASLLLEEGQAIQFRLGAISSAKLPAAPAVYRFKAPLDLSPEHLRKTAPAFDPTLCFVAFEEAPSMPSGLQMWGAHLVGGLVADDTELIFAGFTLRSIRAGHLEGFFGSAQVFRYDPVEG